MSKDLRKMLSLKKSTKKDYIAAYELELFETINLAEGNSPAKYIL